MKLPGIEYGSVPDASASVGRAVDAFSGMGKVISTGLEMYGKELIKTQTMEAQAKLDERLTAAHNDITSRKVFTAKEAKDALGDNISQLAPAARKELEAKADGDQVPSWVVAGALFDQQAKTALDEAA